MTRTASAGTWLLLSLVLAGGLWLWELEGARIWTGAAFSFCL